MVKQILPSHISMGISESDYNPPIVNANNIESVPDDFFKNLKGFLIIGKLIGVLPFSGVFGGSSSNDLKFRRKSLTSILSHVIFAGLVFNTGLELIATFRASKRNALEIAEAIRQSLSIVWGTLIFFTFLLRGNKFIEIFTTWRKTYIGYRTKDKHLRKDVLLISGVILGSGFLENAVLHLEYINSLDGFTGVTFDNKTKNMSLLEAYYLRANPHWAEFISFNWVVPVIPFVLHKWMLYAWNYIDVCIAVFGRAMYFRFKNLCEVARAQLLGQDETMRMENGKKGTYHDRLAWLQVVHDHDNLIRLLEPLETFFSPLIFGSYAVNLFYICVQLLEGLTSEASEHSIVHSIYAPWSFIHLVMRVYIVSICCARINIYAHQINKICQECPVDCYGTEISRLDRRVTTGPDIGLTGLECFVVKKPFILSIISVVFTVEIVLLQCIPNNVLMAMMPMTHSPAAKNTNCPK